MVVAQVWPTQIVFAMTDARLQGSKSFAGSILPDIARPAVFSRTDISSRSSST